ncbi:hypothetical protein Tco_0829545 [Tanacetum coccineum]
MSSLISWDHVHLREHKDTRVVGPEHEGLPWMLDKPYVQVSLQAPPSPDYIPGPEEPQSPPLPDFVPEPVYPEYMPQEDESDSEEDLEEDDDEDPEEDPVYNTLNSARSAEGSIGVTS